MSIDQPDKDNSSIELSSQMILSCGKLVFNIGHHSCFRIYKGQMQTLSESPVSGKLKLKFSWSWGWQQVCFPPCGGIVWAYSSLHSFSACHCSRDCDRKPLRTAQSEPLPSAHLSCQWWLCFQTAGSSAGGIIPKGASYHPDAQCSVALADFPR